MKYLDEMVQKRILIIVPHPDDELNIAGIVINNHKNKDNIWMLYTTNFDIYGKAEVSKRYKELQKLMHYMGVPNNNILFLGFHVYDGTRSQYAYSIRGTTSVMDGELETDEALKIGIERVIKKIKPDIIFSIDCDNHIDHKRTSFAVDNIANEFVRNSKSCRDIPLFFKGFAYATSWCSYNDFYEKNNSTRCFEYGGNTIAPYDWKSRIRIPYIKTSSYSRFLSKCWLRGAYLCYRSQNIYSHIGKCINSDQVFWKLETDNALIGCKVKLSSGTFDSIFDVVKRKDIGSNVEYYPGEWKNIEYSKPIELEIFNISEGIDSIKLVFEVRRAESLIKVEMFGGKQYSFEFRAANIGIIEKELNVQLHMVDSIKIRFDGDIDAGYVVKRIYGQPINSYEDIKITDADKQYLYKIYVTKQIVELRMHQVFRSSLNNYYSMEVQTTKGEKRILPNSKDIWIYEHKEGDISINCIDRNRVVVDSVPVIEDRKAYRFFLKAEHILYNILAKIQGRIYSLSRSKMQKKLSKKT